MNPLRVDRALQYQTACPKRFYFILRYSLLCLIFLITLSGVNVSAAGAAEVKTNCRVHDGSCSQTLEGFDIILDISPKPVTAMRSLVFKISFAGDGPDRAPYIDLGMPGMKMGPNRVMMEKISRTVYVGKGVIVRCPSGRRTWQATVTVPGRGKTDFIFDVIY